MFVCCECCVFSGTGLCSALITRREESYRLWYVVVCDLETSRMRRPCPALGHSSTEKKANKIRKLIINPYPTAFPYGNGMVLHFYQQQESSTTKTVHKVINKGLKAYV